jgi:ribosomal protein S27E
MIEETQGGKVRRCPGCHTLDLVFENNQFTCKRCGFVQKLPMFRRLFDRFKK